MSKANFLKTDWFFGLVVSLVVLGFAGGELLQSLERKAYDLGMGMTSRAPSDRVAVIASGTLDSLPHNGAVVTLFAVCGVTHRDSYLDIVMVGILGALLALVAVIVLGTLFGSF